MGIRGEIFSDRWNSSTDKRTYFFNVKENRTGDIFLNIVESKKHGDTDFERHQIVVFKEDLAGFMRVFHRAADFMASSGAAEKSGGGLGRARRPRSDGGAPK